MNRAAIISIGTNSTRALVVELEPAPAILLTLSTGTRIGEGLSESGTLRDDAVKRTLDVIEEYAAAIREFTPQMHAIATSALRRADNAEAFAESVLAITGAPLEIISGEEEARYSYEGAVSGLPRDRTYGVVDAGGGSTEYADATKHVSCEIGAVRLTERFPNLQGRIASDELARAREEARGALRPIDDFENVDRLVAVGGSATTVCAVLAGRRVEAAYTHLSGTALAHAIDLLASLPLEDRKELPGMNPQRADILLAGAIILDEARAATGHDEVTVSTNDLLLGYLLRR